MRILLAVALCLMTMPAWGADCRTNFAAGLTTEAVRDVQRQLQAHGMKPGPVDGQVGARTCAAVRAYQKAAGLPVDGVIDQKLQNHMHFVAKQKR